MTTAPDAPRRTWPLALAWLLTGLVVGLLGLFLFSLAEQQEDRVLGILQMGAAVLALAVGTGLLSGAARPWRWTRPVSAVFLLVAAVTAVVLLLDDPVFVEDVLLLAVPPLVGGLLTAALAGRGRRRTSRAADA